MIKKNIFTITTSLIILYLSLAGSLTINRINFINISYIDKIGHFGLYFILMAVIIIEHRSSFFNTRQLLLIALIPFSFGILIELMQLYFTTDRKGEILDAISNCAGITVALYLWLVFKPYYKQSIRS
ncbi:MAG: VanZ family protein [Bacteroidales bacterium]|jgi:VanZ family protein|nr:VanZ family protein [Bacteroidales bacterium]